MGKHKGGGGQTHREDTHDSNNSSGKGVKNPLIMVLMVSSVATCSVVLLFTLGGRQGTGNNFQAAYAGHNKPQLPTSLGLRWQPISDRSTIDWNAELRKATATKPERIMENGRPERWADRLAKGVNDRLGIPSHRVGEPRNNYHPDWPLEAPDPLPGVHMVYMYVNGSDPNLCKLKSMFSGIPISSRDRDNGEMRHSLRSLDRFAPWFQGDIYILQGDDAPPRWLNLSHPRIKLVHHKDYFEDPENTLPMFNSDAIHANIHRVPGLNDIWINWNDDHLLTAPVEPEDWVRDGMPVIYHESLLKLEGRWFSQVLRRAQDNMWLAKVYNTLQLIMDEDFEKAEGIYHSSAKHAPHVFSQPMLEFMAKKWRHWYNNMRHAKFRDYDAIDLPNLYNYYCQFTKTCNYTPQDIADNVAQLILLSDDTFEVMNETLTVFAVDPPKFTTFNDAFNAVDGTKGSNFIYGQFFHDYFPLPSQFELADVE